MEAAPEQTGQVMNLTYHIPRSYGMKQAACKVLIKLIVMLMKVNVCAFSSTSYDTPVVRLEGLLVAFCEIYEFLLIRRILVSPHWLHASLEIDFTALQMVFEALGLLSTTLMIF